MEDSETPSSDRSRRNSDEAVADCSDPFFWLFGCLAVGGDWLTDFQDGNEFCRFLYGGPWGDLKNPMGWRWLDTKKRLAFLFFLMFMM